ncbi:PRC-barrel domain-containing protein [Devriesea agamarum]|uniref:PRC-barrel domain-containing protein n=1 Tax=Devriesea agamarum TaxID=472569 RepID=UPI00071CD017|nr:PRC-barrel domain-containing protein [Devriesea agamarum]
MSKPGTVDMEDSALNGIQQSEPTPDTDVMAEAQEPTSEISSAESQPTSGGPRSSHAESKGVQEQYRALRNASVFGADGHKIGKVGDIYLDDSTQHPTFLTVTMGLFGTKEVFVPVALARIDDDAVHLVRDRDEVKAAPTLDADGHLTPEEEREIFQYYGLDYDQTVRGDAGEAPGSGDDGDHVADQGEQRRNGEQRDADDPRGNADPHRDDQYDTNDECDANDHRDDEREGQDSPDRHGDAADSQSGLRSD